MNPHHFVNSLMKPESYPWQLESVELIETHISWVFLAGDRVVKVKRPVDLGFVDHMTLARRRHSCEEEVRLNRRLTDDVYLGVTPIVPAGDGVAVDGEGDAIEWATLMRRLPADAMLDVRLRAGRVPDRLADRLADRLIPFHRDVAPIVPGSPSEVSDIVTTVVLDNLDELAVFPVALVQFGLVATAMRRFLSDQPGRMADRAAQGWVRDGHGDLRCEHVCITETGQLDIFDCVEFSPELRCVDVASDLAFLLMDLDRLGAGGEAEQLLTHYRQAGFDLPDDLLRFFWAHRALVRAKVWNLREPDRLTHADRAIDYLNLAMRQVVTTQPALVCMTGLSGTGKSVIARQLHNAMPVSLLTADRIRKELAGVGGSATSGWETGIYTERWTEATYNALYGQARTLLEAGRTVLLDATFLDGRQRQRAAELAKAMDVPFVLVETTCMDTEVRRRLAARAARGKDPSDAGIDVYERQLAHMLESPPGVPDGAAHVFIDTSRANSAPLDLVCTVLTDEGILNACIPDTPLEFRQRRRDVRPMI